GGLYQTTFHPNLVGRPGRMLMLERLLGYMRGFDDVWWGTCEQAAAHAAALGAARGDGA
ncbi:MAG: ribulose phosphate epimerase, partial [Gammaproteobacteria bacterium]|nr:ribulose phosphate epimerase [Gammaproteobacteria bacterium]